MRQSIAKERVTTVISLNFLVQSMSRPAIVAPIRPQNIISEPHKPLSFCERRKEREREREKVILVH